MNMTTEQAVATLTEQRKMGEGHIDWTIVRGLVRSEQITQRELSRSTGISQGWISRKIRHLEGVPLSEMDAHRAWLRRPKKPSKKVTL